MSGAPGRQVSALAGRFAALMRRLDGRAESPVLDYCARRLIEAVAAGHGCLDLEQIAAPFAADEIRRVLSDSPAAARAGAGAAPMVVDGTRLYLKRFYDDECSVAHGIAALCARRAGLDPLKLSALAEAVSRGADPSQRRAVAAALAAGFSVITGGPGSGKTATAVRIMAGAILRARAEGAPPPRIALAAPTGKAAARLAESIKRSCQEGAVPAELVEAILADLDARSFTLHRLLGFSRERGVFRRGREDPLACDLVILDEASMASLTLTARLLAALPAEAALVMLGDKDQLASVDAGAVLGDICRAGLSGAGPVAGRIAELTENHRSGGAPRIAAAAAAVRRADAAELMRALGETHLADEDYGAFLARLDGIVHEKFEPIGAAGSAAEALALAQRFRVIAAANVGPCGADAINRRVRARLGFPAQGRCRGEPVMATENDYDLRVFNGDVGVIWDGGGGAGRLAAWFPSGDGDLVPLPLARFSALVPFYAATVHKSQGSEYDEVFFVLPERSALAARELVYTAVTRAKAALWVWSGRRALGAALERRTVRHGGLAERLKRG